MIKIRTGQSPAMLDRQTFGQRFRLACSDPLYEEIADALERVKVRAVHCPTGSTGWD